MIKSVIGCRKIGGKESVENMIKSVSLQNANTDSERVNFRDFGKPCKRACHTKKD